MPQHNRATEVTVVPVSEKPALQVWVESNWKFAAGLALVLTLGVLLAHLLRQRKASSAGESWTLLESQVQFAGGIDPVKTPSPGVMAELAANLAGEPAGPWARLLHATASLEKRDYEGARAALAALRREYPKHALVVQPRSFEPGSPSVTPVEFLEKRLGQLEAWDSAHPRLFTNPPLPEGAPRVRLNTTQGSILLGLYSDRAPKHVENFLKLCREGFYNGTKFHRVVTDFMIQGGDPNTREGDPSTWGSGGPGYKLDAELAPELFHFKGILAAAKLPGDAKSSGSGFYITTGTPHHLDGEHTIFGQVLEGADIVQSIEKAPLAEGSDRPVEPTAILSVDVL